MGHDEDRKEGSERRSVVDRQDASGIDVPAGRPAAEIAPEEVRPARVVTGEREERGDRGEGEDDAVATVHADASPARETTAVRAIGNTDVPVNARDPDAP